MNKRIYKSNIKTFFLLLILAVFMIIFEAVAFGKYVETKSDSGLEAFGILGVIAYALIFACPLFVCAIGKLVVGANAKKADGASLRRWTLVSVIIRFVGALALIVAGVVFLCIYRGGYFSKALYFAVAGLEIFLAVKEIALLKKLK